MAALIKKFLFGLLYLIVLPALLVVLSIYAVFGLVMFVFIGLKAFLMFFTGNNLFGELPEDAKAKKILLERERQLNMANNGPMVNPMPAQTPYQPPYVPPQPTYQQPQYQNPQPTYQQPQQPQYQNPQPTYQQPQQPTYNQPQQPNYPQNPYQNNQQPQRINFHDEMANEPNPTNNNDDFDINKFSNGGGF